MFDYDNKEELDAIETLPIPSNQFTKFVAEDSPDFIKENAYQLDDHIE
jgi:hypothetical protein